MLSVYDLPLIPAPAEWAERAACKGEPIHIFYPPSGRRPTIALQVCQRCEVRQECLDYAIENHQHWGVWGGMTERQRFEEKRRRKRQSR